jgi:hypothetical protein
VKYLETRVDAKDVQEGDVIPGYAGDPDRVVARVVLTGRGTVKLLDEKGFSIFNGVILREDSEININRPIREEEGEEG